MGGLEQLINKKYYRMFVKSGESQYPLEILGEAYFNEQTMDGGDLSPIRFAQGEVYYHIRDLEAAINKWENVSNELEPWAKKNIGDAYYELGLVKDAEKTYLSINTQSTVLSVEVAMQLISLYSKSDNMERVYEYIDKAIAMDPDYPNITEIARIIYEEQGDWQSAVVLAMNEGIRTASVKWFQVLNGYVDKGYTKDFEPDDFYEALRVLYGVDQSKFSQLTESLCDSYKQKDTFLSWVNTKNRLFSEIEMSTGESWEEVSEIHYESFLELMNGGYLIKELDTVIPKLLNNWLKFTTEKRALFHATAVMAWSEFFPSSVDTDTLKDSEKILFNNEHFQDSVDETLGLFEPVFSWAESNQLKIGEETKWFLSRLTDVNTNHLLITGKFGSGKEKIVNSILEERLLGDKPVTMVVSEAIDGRELSEITPEGIQPVNDIADLRKNALVELKMSSMLLKKLNCSLISSPDIFEKNLSQNDSLQYINLSDGILYVLDASRPFREDEFQELLNMYEHAPNLQVHFLLHRMSGDTNEPRVLEETRSKLNELFPNAQILSYSTANSAHEQSEKLVDFINNSFSFQNSVDISQQTLKLQYLIRNTLSELLEKRTAMEYSYNKNVVFIGEIMVRLQGLVDSIKNIQLEKTRIINESFRSVKEETKRNIKDNLPGLLRNCTEFVKEDSDFRVIHEELNECMNETIEVYFQDQVIPQFQKEQEEWLEGAETELQETQEYLDEMSKTFNKLNEDNIINLNCDDRILFDWGRDINRMAQRVALEKENIMNRSKPSQLILKSAGTVFGNIPQAKPFLYNQYKRHVGNADYKDVTASILDKYFLGFDLFEKDLKSDISLFFQEPFNQININIAEAEAERESVKERLENIKQNPEFFYDPLKIFEVRLLQCKMMKQAKEDQQYITQLGL